MTVALIELSSTSGPRGSKRTLVALGVEGGESITFFLDKDGDGVRDAIERDLGTVVADFASDTATLDIVINNPPFQPGEGSGSCK